MKHAVALVLLLAFAAAGPGAALANDASIGGSGANVYPIDNADVQLVRETIRFVETDSGVMLVTTALTFRNKTDREIRARIGFPVATTAMYEEQDTQSFGGETLIDEFTTRVGGKAAKTDLVKTRIEGIEADAVYAFDAAFAPGGETVIEHRYRLKVSVGVPDRHWIPYVFRTGAKWAGRIESSEFIYEFGPRVPTHLEFVYGDTVLVGGGIRPTGKREKRAGFDVEAHFTGGPRHVLRVVMRDLEPKKDLELRYRAGLSYEAPEFPAKGGDERASDCGEALNQFRETWVVTPELTACFEPNLLRNYVYASRGFAFTKADWDRMFYAKGYFLPSTAPFSESWMTAAQKAAIEKLKGAGE
ncbi:MAG: YARHG domain-containing protein [Deltaproteobacteria bacterium]|nr:YARHG domain-containing protein [Deltaproteobacteria bacterium]